MTDERNENCVTVIIVTASEDQTISVVAADIWAMTTIHIRPRQHLNDEQNTILSHDIIDRISLALAYSAEYIRDKKTVFLLTKNIESASDDGKLFIETFKSTLEENVHDLINIDMDKVGDINIFKHVIQVIECNHMFQGFYFK